MDSERALVLVVDDIEANRDLLARRLERQGHAVCLAENGRQALQMVQEKRFDLILCDLMMPDMNGYEVLSQLKADAAHRHIPVIMVSALDDMDNVVRCIQLGAEDYLFKPFNPTLLKARVNACLEKKRWRDQEQAYLAQLQAEQEKSERLLLSILPGPIAQRLKQGHNTIAEHFADASVLFADIVDFTALAHQRSPIEVVNLLNTIFSTFDELADRHGLEKIKTIGDAYMVVGGIPIAQDNHMEAILDMALDMQAAIKDFNQTLQQPLAERLQLRIGISSGPVVAGVIGTKKFIYDLWGDTVNTASRMESHGIPNEIQVTDRVYTTLQHAYQFVERGRISVKGKGEMQTYLLKGRQVA